MAQVLLFHHAMGQTEGFHAFADILRQAGHTVHTPDLFDGRTFASIEDGMVHVERLGFGHFLDQGTAAAQDLPDGLVYIGFSLGVVPAQKLAQTRAGARGAVLCYSFVPASEFGCLAGRPAWRRFTAWTQTRTSRRRATSRTLVR